MEAKYIVKIKNGNHELTLTFLTAHERNAMKQAIENCIIKPEDYPTINYSDRKDDIILTAEYLKKSLIVMPKV